MRILMISDVYFPRVNGVSTSIQTFRQELTQRGHRVDLIAPAYPAQWQDDEHTQRIPSRYLFVDPEDRIIHYRKLMQLLPDLKRQHYDVVHIQTPFIAHYAGVKLARALQIPCIESYHTYFEEYLFHYVPWLPKNWMRAAARFFTRKQCAQLDALIVPSSAMRDALFNYGIDTAMHIIPTGIRLEQFKGGDGARFRNKHNIPLDRPTLVHIGRVAHEKNIGFVIECLAEIKSSIPNVLLVIAGEGPALNGLRKQAQQLKLSDNIKFVGYLSREHELLDCYKAGDVFVFASKTETQGLVLLEAMTLGVPVVSTAYMGAKDILATSQGALVAEDSVTDFSQKVCTLLNDAALRARLSAEGIEYVKQWSAGAMAETLLTFYGQLKKHPTLSAPNNINSSPVDNL
ncbi:MAG: glycosyltransferase [Gammaproteobacteria bacterium]|nr:glycosyltransferase [Gammaproteobacteria bacterium]